MIASPDNDPWRRPRKAPPASRIPSSSPPRVAWTIGLIVVALWSCLGGSALGQETAFERALREERFEDAVQLARKTLGEHPKSAVASFDLGRAQAAAGDLDGAIVTLLESARQGFAGVASLERDAHLGALRAHPRFGAVREAVAANAAARFDRFRAVAENASPTLVLPPRHDPAVPAPLIIALHGSGGTGAQLADAWRDAAAAIGAILIAPDALRPEPGTDGYSWVFRDEAEWLVLRTIDQARQRFAIGSVILTGFSQGANLALMLGQTQASRFAGVIPVCGHYEPDVADVPREGARPRWLLLTGADDPWAHTYGEAERAFRAAGLEVRSETVRGMGHRMPAREVLQEALRWVLERPRSARTPHGARHLGATVPPAAVWLR